MDPWPDCGYSHCRKGLHAVGEAHGWDNDKAQGSHSREHQCGGIKTGTSPMTDPWGLRGRSPLPRGCALSPLLRLCLSHLYIHPTLKYLTCL